MLLFAFKRLSIVYRLNFDNSLQNLIYVFCLKQRNMGYYFREYKLQKEGLR